MDTNYQDNSLEDWHKQQAEIERTNTMPTNEEPKKILLTVGELREALAPFGDDTPIIFIPPIIPAPLEDLYVHRIWIEAGSVVVELLPLFEAEDESE